MLVLSLRFSSAISKMEKILTYRLAGRIAEVNAARRADSGQYR